MFLLSFYLFFKVYLQINMNEGARKSAFPWKIVQTHSADEDGMIWLIAPEPASEH